MLTPEWHYLRQHLDYDLSTGVFRWKVRGMGRRMDRPAGSAHKSGYWQVWVLGRLYLAHVLAHFIVSGDWPEHHIDHVDGNGLNNRWLNLRPATRVQNNQNVRRRKDNTSGHPGVHWDKTIGAWKAQASQDGVRQHLGLFDSLEDAVAVRQAFVEKNYSHYTGRDAP